MVFRPDAPLLVKGDEMSFGVDMALPGRRIPYLVGHAQNLVFVPGRVSLHGEENGDPARSVRDMVLEGLSRRDLDLQPVARAAAATAAAARVMVRVMMTGRSVVALAPVGRGQGSQARRKQEIGACMAKNERVP